jgi:fatty acid-binding protein DegV
LLDDGISVPRVVQQIDGLRQQVRTLVVPADVSFFQRRSRLDGEAPLAWLSYGVGKVLDRTPLVRAQGAELSVVTQLRGFDAAVARAFESVTQQVRTGLAAPFVCVSFAGDETSVRQLPAFIALEDACLRHQVTLHLASMSMGNALLVGRGALAVSFASDP